MWQHKVPFETLLSSSYLTIACKYFMFVCFIILVRQPDNAGGSCGFPLFDDVSVKNAVYNNQEDERDDIENSGEDCAELGEIRSLRVV